MNSLVSLDAEIAPMIGAPTNARFKRRMSIAVVCGLFAAAGFLVGGFSGLNHAAQHSHSRGACIALEFAENFGAVGATQKRQALRAMTHLGAGEQGLFPKTLADFEELCIRTWTSEVRLGVKRHAAVTPPL